MIVMYTIWALAKNTSATKPMAVTPGNLSLGSAGELTPLIPTDSRGHATRRTRLFDIVDILSVDLYKDEHVEDADEELNDEEVKQNDLQGRFGWLWRLYYLIV